MDFVTDRDLIESGLNVDDSQPYGLPERRLLAYVAGKPQERFPYPTHLEEVHGVAVEFYDIPEDSRKSVLEQLYPFDNVPSLDRTMVDLHTNRRFRVGDYRVTREGDFNFLVTPYYTEAGGTVLDWMEETSVSSSNSTQEKEA